MGVALSPLLLSFACMLSTAPGLWMHGGQYEPPPSEPEVAATPVDGLLAQPGFGPVLEFDPLRWEWWFDFNEEGLLELRARMAARTTARAGRLFQPVDDDIRVRVVLPTLITALADRNRDVRAAAAMALGRLGLDQALAPLSILAQDDRNLFVRTQAVIALGFSGLPGASETLQTLWEDEDLSDEIRSFALVGIALNGADEGVLVLSEALSEKRLTRAGTVLRATTAYAAGLHGDPTLLDGLKGLSRRWFFKQEPQFRALTAVALGQAGRRGDVPFVLGLLDDKDNQVRRSAAAGLAALAPQLTAADVETLIDRLDDEGDLAVRLNLLRGLGRARLDRSSSFLRSTYADARYLQRTHHVLALAFDGNAANIPLLLEAFGESREPSLRSACAVALGLLGEVGITEELMAALERGGPPLQRGYLALALGLLDPPQSGAVEPLEALARESNDVEVIRLASAGLGLLGAREALDRLADTVTDDGGAITRAARLYGLGKVGDRATLSRLLAVATDVEQTAYVRAYALQAIADVCDPRDLPPMWRLSRHVELHHDVAFLSELYRTL